MSFTDPAFLGIVAVLLLSLAWHEAAHAWVADKLGDPTGRELGRITLNPFKHLDPFLSVVLPVVMYLTVGVLFGGGKPVPIQPSRFRHHARDFMLVALAGPGSNLVLAALLTALFAGVASTGVFHEEIVYQTGRVDVVPPSLVRGTPDHPFMTILRGGIFLNVLLAVFNLMPIPPLDGSRVIGWILPRPVQGLWYGLDRFGFLLLIVVLYLLDGFRYLQMVMGPVISGYHRAADQLVGIVAS